MDVVRTRTLLASNLLVRFHSYSMQSPAISKSFAHAPAASSALAPPATTTATTAATTTATHKPTPAPVAAPGGPVIPSAAPAPAAQAAANVWSSLSLPKIDSSTLLTAVGGAFAALLFKYAKREAEQTGYVWPQLSVPCPEMRAAPDLMTHCSILENEAPKLPRGDEVVLIMKELETNLNCMCAEYIKIRRLCEEKKLLDHPLAYTMLCSYAPLIEGILLKLGLRFLSPHDFVFAKAKAGISNAVNNLLTKAADLEVYSRRLLQ
jgi:hypothetical protein